MKGEPLSIHPAFLGEDFTYQKNRMEMCINSAHYQFYQVIIKGNIKIASPEKTMIRKTTTRCNSITRQCILLFIHFPKTNIGKCAY